LPIQKELTPAPAPTVIPTQPLPTITPIPVSTTNNDYCKPATSFSGDFTDATGMECTIIQMTDLILHIMPIFIALTIFALLIGILGHVFQR
jgi:hypothetical protein